MDHPEIGQTLSTRYHGNIIVLQVDKHKYEILALVPDDKANPYYIWSYNYDGKQNDKINCYWSRCYKTLKEAVEEFDNEHNQT